MLLAKSGWVLKTILFDYALIPAPRDTICGLNAHMTARNDIRNIHLFSIFIRGHKRSMEVTGDHQMSHINNNTQGSNFVHVYSNFYQKLHRVC